MANFPSVVWDPCYRICLRFDLLDSIVVSFGGKLDVGKQSRENE